MADKKISALTGATTPLAGTEVLPIVQGGSTVKVSVANLTAGRAITAANVTASGELTTTTNDARISMFRSAGTNYFDWASGQTLAFGTQTSQGGAGRVSKVNFLDNGDLTNVTGNFVVGTAGKGIDFSANTHAAGMTSELLNDYEEGTFTPALAVASGSLTSSVQGTSQYIKIGRLVTASGYINVSSVSLPSGALTITGLPYAANNFTAVTLSLFTGGFTQAYSGYVSSASTTISIPNLNASIMVGGENVMFTATYQTT
jgi:hypothetical protein